MDTGINPGQDARMSTCDTLILFKGLYLIPYLSTFFSSFGAMKAIGFDVC